MLSRFKKDVSTPEKIRAKAKEFMRDVVGYRMSGTIDASSYSNLKTILAELVEEHCLNNEDFDETICFEPEKVINSIDLVELIKGVSNPREIVIPANMYAAFITSYCREAIGAVLSDYALKFNRSSANTVSELRDLILASALAYATGLDENLDKINLILHDGDSLRIIKPSDEAVAKILIKHIVNNFDMFYIRKVYLEKVNIINEKDGIRSAIFKVKFYNNSLYILRVLLNLNRKSYGENALDIGVANCCRISGVKLRDDLDVVVASLEKFANRKGYLGLEFIETVAEDVNTFHNDMINNKVDYNLILATIEMLTENADLNLIREIIASISVLILRKCQNKSIGKLGVLEQLCLLDGIIGKAF